MYGTKEQCRTIHMDNVRKGFWDGFSNKEERLPECVALIHAKISEILEAARANKKPNFNEFHNKMNIESADFYSTFKNTIKDTVEDEFADTAIRIMDLAGALDIDIEVDENQLTYTGPLVNTINKLHWFTGLLIIRNNNEKVDLTPQLKSLFRFLLGAARGLNIDLVEHVKLKLEYNKLRPHKHGKSF